MRSIRWRTLSFAAWVASGEKYQFTVFSSSGSLTNLPGNPSDFPGTDSAAETNNARVKRLLRWFRPVIPLLPVLKLIVLAIGQNRPSIIEIKGLKTSHFKESKTVPWDREKIRSVGAMSNLLKVRCNRKLAYQECHDVAGKCLISRNTQ
jgi:hypothetical protein